MREAGHNYREIGAALGITEQGASMLVLRELERWVEEPAKAVIKLELARTDSVIKAHLPFAIGAVKVDEDGSVVKAVGAELLVPSTKHADVVERFMARRAKLQGLDAPTKTEAKEEHEFTGADEILSKLARIADAAAKGGDGGAVKPG